jgi:hypothetical protein
MMFGKGTTVILVLALALICAVGATAEGTGTSPAAGVLASIGTAFTYQGQLQSGGTPVDSDCDFVFSLWDAVGSGSPPTGGNQVGSFQPAPNIPVTNGLFAVRLDFGSDAFRGEARWLQTAVRCPAGGGDYTTLAPRQALTPVPYALFSQDLGLPFDNWTESSVGAFEVRNAGTGPAGVFEIDDPTNDSAALKAHSRGSGAALGAFTWNDADALWAIVNGTGDAAVLHLDNPDNPGTVINARTKGTGLGASISIQNTLNTHSALGASTNGSGNAGDFNTSGSGSAVRAETSGSGWAGDFTATGSGNGVRISAPAGNLGLDVVGGTKNAVVGSSDGARLLYSEESSGVWFSDYGFGRLTDGAAFIAIDPVFAETVNLDQPYHVFVQPYGDAELYVSRRTPMGFEVCLRAGDANVEFSYRLVAARRGYENTHLERAPWADDDPNLSPARPALSQQGGAQ